jgi:hypothetical protein
VTKCICRVLNGFHFEGIPDAMEEILRKGDTIICLDQQTEKLGAELDEVFRAINPTVEEIESSESEQEEDVKMEPPANDEEEMKDIQSKLFTKVLPILERHLSDTQDASSENPPIIRAFVVESILKTIRKLPVHTF